MRTKTLEGFIINYLRKFVARSRKNVVISKGCGKSPCTATRRFLPAVEMTKTHKISYF